MMDVVKHAINYIGGDYTYVWLLQPTSPFRDVKDFKVIKSIIESGIYNSVISYKETKDHPNRTYTIKEEDDKITAHPLRHVNFKNKQDLIPVYIRSGNFYVSKVGAVMETNTFENKPIYPYIVDKIKGINIDSEEDMILAKHYLNYGTVKL
jgi:CMP-N-acetylneuraminic acid synthetase